MFTKCLLAQTLYGQCSFENQQSIDLPNRRVRCARNSCNTTHSIVFECIWRANFDCWGFGSYNMGSHNILVFEVDLAIELTVFKKHN
jgi:hypothetical protein